MRVRLELPATTANLGPGFDALGLALELRNAYELELTDAGFSLEVEGPGRERIPADAEQSLIARAFQEARAALGQPPAPGLAMKLELTVPPCSGLGSSATATLAGILAANAFGDGSLDERAVIELATRLEGHPDNVVPCALGGLCVAVSDGDRVVWLREEPRDPPAFVLALPEALELSTSAMREVLPATVPFGDAVFNLSRAALLTLALARGDADALRTALEDRLHQPYRGALIPGFAQVRAAAGAAGALGTVISGSGPTLLALSPLAMAEAVGQAMVSAWAETGVTAVSRVIPVATEGARLVSGGLRPPESPGTSSPESLRDSARLVPKLSDPLRRFGFRSGRRPQGDPS